jgi:hypothetical protein
MRVVMVIAAIFGGVVVGTITTIYHSAWFPFGLVAAVGLVGVFVASLRVVSPSRALATFGSAGVIGVITLLAGLDSQGSVLIAGNTAGLAFLGSVTLLSMVVLAWPKLTPRATGYDGEHLSSERTPRP